MKPQKLMLAVAAGALAVVPAAAQGHGRSGDHPHGKSGTHGHHHCTIHRGYVVTGTLVSYTADDPATPKNETSITITVRHANRPARDSGELTDVNPTKKGVQVRGGSYTLANPDDAYKVRLAGFETGETPSAGDKVRIIGKIAYTKKRCAEAGTSVADRYGDVNVRRVKIIDADGD